MSGGEPAEARYAMAGIDADAERARLEKLERLNDAASLRRIDAIGVGPGWRCVEIGAGAGSIARGLAKRVGPGGLVVAADRDPRFLTGQKGFEGPGRSVVTHDITQGPVPPADFDFAHCRAVLAHVEDLAGAAEQVVASLRPGGWVLCEEPDYGVMEACDPNHPRAPVFAAYLAAMTRGDRMDAYAGRHVFEVLRRTGLEEISTDSHGAIAIGGSFRAQYRKHTMENARELALASGSYSEASFQALLDLFDDPSFAYFDNSWVATMGRVPE